MVVGLLLLFAVPLGLARVVGVGTVLPARTALLVVGVVAAIVLAALAVRRRTRPLVLIAIALVVICGLGVPGTVSRGFADEGPAPPASGQLRVLEWNTNGDLVTPATVAKLAAREHANVVVLPYAPAQGGPEGVTEAFAARGLHMMRFAPSADAAEIVVYLSDDLASHYRAARLGPDPIKTLSLSPTGDGLPTIVALHAPIPLPGRIEGWRADLRWVERVCAGGSVLVAGDFNASLDDFGGDGLGACRDAAQARGDAAVGTWPVWLPTALAMPIDHVLATPSVGRVLSFSVLTGEDGSGARHRPTMTVIQLGS